MRQSIPFKHKGINCEIWQPHRKDYKGRVYWLARAYLRVDKNNIMVTAEPQSPLGSKHYYESTARSAAIECAEAILNAGTHVVGVVD